MDSLCMHINTYLDRELEDWSAYADYIEMGFHLEPTKVPRPEQQRYPYIILGSCIQGAIHLIQLDSLLHTYAILNPASGGGILPAALAVSSSLSFFYNKKFEVESTQTAASTKEIIVKWMEIEKTKIQCFSSLQPALQIKHIAEECALNVLPYLILPAAAYIATTIFPTHYFQVVTQVATGCIIGTAVGKSLAKLQTALSPILKAKISNLNEGIAKFQSSRFLSDFSDFQCFL